MKIFSTPNRFFIAAAFIVLAAFVINLLFDAGHAQLRFAGSPWPIFRGDASLTGRAKVVGPKIPELARIIRPPNNVAKDMLSPILPEENTVVYTFRGHRTLYIEHLKSGQSFKFDAGEFNASPVAGKNGVAYVGLTDGWLYAIDTRNGEKLWSMQPREGDPINSSVNVSADGSIIYAVTDGGFFCAIRNDGTPQIEALFLGHAGKGVTPAIDANGRVYVANGPEVYVFRSNGSMWSLSNAMRHPESGNFEWVATSANIVFAGSSRNPFVTAFDADNGQTLWKSDDPALSSAEKPAISLEGRLYLVGAENNEKKLKALDIRNGEELSSNNRAPFTGMPVIDALGRIYLVARVDQSVHDFFGFEPDRKELWSPIRLPLSYDGFLRESPAFGADGAIYIPGYGALYVVRPQPAYAKKLIRDSGDGQKGCAGNTLPLPLRVRVRDQYDSSFASQRVDFRIVTGDGSLNINTAQTDSDGIAPAFWKLGTGAATQKVEARIYRPHESTKDSVVVFTATRLLAQIGGDKIVAFKKTLVKDTSYQICVIRNDSDCPLPLQSLQIINDARAGFSICAPKPGETIPPRGSLQICLRFAPKGDGDHTAILQARSSVTNPQNYDITLHGLGEVDDKPPEAPENFSLVVSARGWRNMADIFVFTWDNPRDSSGVVSACYKVGGKAPTSNNDKDGCISLMGSPQLRVSAPRDRNGSLQPGKYPVYVWLTDRFGNVDCKNFAVDTIRFDNAPPSLLHKPRETLAQIGQAVPIAVETGDSLAQMESATLFFRSGGKLNFTAQSLRFPREMTVIPGNIITTNGAAYYIIAKDRAGNVKRFPGPDSIYSVQVELAAGALDKKQHKGGKIFTAFRLRSFPLDFPATPAHKIFGETFKFDQHKLCRLFGIGPPRADSLLPFLEYPNVQEFEPGRAMFMITSDDRFIYNPAGYSAKTGEPFIRNLHKGWNLVASPFNFEVPFQNSTLADFLNHAYYYDGAWQRVTPTFHFQPWEGVAIKIHDNDDDDEPQQLVIWPVEEALRSRLKVGTVHPNPEPVWSIQIKALCFSQQDTIQDAMNFAGVTIEADSAWDEHDELETPPLGDDYVALYFPHRQWRKHADQYATDFQRPAASGNEWRFETRTNLPGKAIELKFERIHLVPPQYQIYLIDEALKLPVDLRGAPSYRFRFPDHETQRYAFRLLVGNKEYLEKHLDNMDGLQRNPTQFQVTKNFPNPFNAATTIRFSLPQPARVSLTIYDLKGEVVRTLLDGKELAAGFYTAVWDGRNAQGEVAATGIYLYRFQTPQSAVKQKMTLIK